MLRRRCYQQVGDMHYSMRTSSHPGSNESYFLSPTLLPEHPDMSTQSAMWVTSLVAACFATRQYEQTLIKPVLYFFIVFSLSFQTY